MATTVIAELIVSQEPPPTPKGVPGSQGFGPSFAAFQDCMQRAEWKGEVATQPLYPPWLLRLFFFQMKVVINQSDSIITDVIGMEINIWMRLDPNYYQPVCLYL